MSKYNVGDVVQLKSGGPKMTITDLPKVAISAYRTGWFAGSKYETAHFPEEALQVPADVKKA